MYNNENKINKKRLRSSYISVVISLSLVLFIIAFIGVLLLNARDFSRFVKENISLEVVFSNNATKGSINELVKKVKLSDYVLTENYIDKKQALIKARKATGMSKDDPFYNELIYPSSLQIYLKADYVEPQKVDSIVRKLRSFNGVSQVSYPKAELEIVYRNINKINFVALIIAGLFFIIAVILINNAIRLNIYTKRFAIKTMQLIGAKKSFIQRPFLLKSILIGFISALIALIMLFGILYYVFSHQKVFEKSFMPDYYSLTILSVSVVIIGALLSFISTYFASSKFLKLPTEKLYY